MDIKAVCRVCLKPEQSEHTSLFDKYKQNFLFEYINVLTRVNIMYNDGFSDKICQDCFKQLKTAINFREKCEESNNYFVEFALKNDLYSVDNIKNEDSKEHMKIEVEEESQEDYFSYPDLSDRECEDPTSEVVIESLAVKESIDKRVQCHDCGNMFKSKCKLRVHWKRDHMLQNLICHMCKRTFKTYKALKSHAARNLKSCSIASDQLVTVTGSGRERVFSCKECDYKSKRINDMGTHLVIHTGARPFQCNLCPKNFTQHSTLQSHKEAKHSEGMLMTCHFCGKNIRGPRNFYKHLQYHTDNKVTCTICKKVMNKKSYATHKKRHTGVKTYTCEKCASTFYTMAELCNHRRWVHNKTKQFFKCDLCEYKSLRPYRIKEHRKMHNDKNLACTTCGRFYLSPEMLAAHQKSHFGEKKFSCPHCDMKFYRYNSVDKHKRKKHAIIVKAEKIVVERKNVNVGAKIEDVETDED